MNTFYFLSTEGSVVTVLKLELDLNAYIEVAVFTLVNEDIEIWADRRKVKSITWGKRSLTIKDEFEQSWEVKLGELYLDDANKNYLEHIIRSAIAIVEFTEREVRRKGGEK